MRALQRRINTVANRRAADEDRYAAYEFLAEDGSPEAIYGLLLRFTYVKDIGQRSRSTDEEDKQYVYRLVVRFGEQALPQIRQFLTAKEGPATAPKHSISWALRILEEIAPNAEIHWEVLQDVFADNEPGYERDPSRKIELMTYLAGTDRFDPAQVTEVVLPYLDDPDEDVRFATAEALLKQGHPSCRDALSRLLADPDESLQIRSLILSGFIRAGWLDAVTAHIETMPLSALLAAVEALEHYAEESGSKRSGAQEGGAAQDPSDASGSQGTPEKRDDSIAIRDVMLTVAEANQADEAVLSRVAEFFVHSGISTQGVRGRVERFLPKGYKIRKARVERLPEGMREPFLTHAASRLLDDVRKGAATREDVIEPLIKIVRSQQTDPATKGRIVEVWATEGWSLKGHEKLVVKHLPPGYKLDPTGKIRRHYESMVEPYLTQAADRLVDPYLSEPPDDPDEARTCLDDETREWLLQIASNPKTDERTVDRVMDRFAAYGWSIRGYEKQLLRTLPKAFKIVAPRGAGEPHLTKVSTRI